MFLRVLSLVLSQSLILGYMVAAMPVKAQSVMSNNQVQVSQTNMYKASSSNKTVAL